MWPKDNGFPEIESKKLATAFPNPVSDFLTVNLQGNQSVKISLYDVEGRELYQSVSASGEKKEILMRDYERGVYLLKVSNGMTFQTKKIIKK